MRTGGHEDRKAGGQEDRTTGGPEDERTGGQDRWKNFLTHISINVHVLCNTLLF